jgi:hypothetical protein
MAAKIEEKNEQITVTVISKKEGFRRGGNAWSETPTETTVTPNELAQLQAEPMLIVVVKEK